MSYATQQLHEILGDTRNINVQKIFDHFNMTYFDGKLTRMKVRWSNKMTLCAGQFQWGKNDLQHGSEIVLSEPLLKLRPKNDTLNTLVHEMIHAYLHVTKQRDDSDHGKLFMLWRDAINNAEGTKITIYHTFHDEVDYYRQHVWACDKCGNIVKRVMNRDPNAPCGPQDVNFYTHKQICNGIYIKIHAPEKSLLSKKKRNNKDENQKTLESFIKKVEQEDCLICGRKINRDILNTHVNKCLDNSEIIILSDDSTSLKRKATAMIQVYESEIIDLTDEEPQPEQKKQRFQNKGPNLEI
jgi:predicted SprT family Zn-dependent metalloprotease